MQTLWKWAKALTKDALVFFLISSNMLYPAGIFDYMWKWRRNFDVENALKNVRMFQSRIDDDIDVEIFSSHICSILYFHVFDVPIFVTFLAKSKFLYHLFTVLINSLIFTYGHTCLDPHELLLESGGG